MCIREPHIIYLALLSLSLVSALDNGVGLLPPLGYNTWNDLGRKLSSSALRARVDAMVSSGLVAAGYTYFNLDDGWASDSRGADGRLLADPAKFPEGMANFSRYVHSHGLKLGLYTDRGTKTCLGKPGSYGYEKVDAQQYAEWEIDYLKEDNCKAPGGANNHTEAHARFAMMRDALNSTGRRIFFSVCGGGDQLPLGNLSYYAHPPFGSALANSWRISADATEWLTTLHALGIDGELAQYASAGAYNDPDMLLSSTHGAVRKLGTQQSRTQFSIWAILAAPMLIGGPISSLSSWDMYTFTNREVLAVSQDALVSQGTKIAPGIWARLLHTGSVAVVMANDAFYTRAITCDAACWSHMPSAHGPCTIHGPCHFTVRDLWLHEPPIQSWMRHLVAGQEFSISMPGYWSSFMFKLTPVP